VVTRQGRRSCFYGQHSFLSYTDFKYSSSHPPSHQKYFLSNGILALFSTTSINAGSITLLNIYKEKGHTMIISTNVKAGAIASNHNEKLASDNKVKSFTVKTGVKAGECNSYLCGNHNEKLADDNSSSIEQKKTLGKKLRLSKETIRELKDGDLKRIAGGGSYYTASCNVTCRLG
jgi:hypothetical protein